VGLGVLTVVIVGLGASRLMHLLADPPVRGLGRVASFYGDEGVWYGASLWFVEHGQLYVPGDYNPVVLMPVMPTLVGVVAAVTGLEVWYTARLITALLMMGATAALIVALARRAGWGVALLSGLLLTASFTFFVYSRLALLDVPAVAWVVFGLCLLLGWRQRRPTWATAAAALIGCLAVLTKSTMILAMPGYLVAAWMTPNPGVRRWRDPLIISVIGVALVGGYTAAAIAWLPQDTINFRKANISVGDNSPLDKAVRFIKAGRFMGLGFYALATACVPLALWRLRRDPAYPWVVAGVVWVVLMSLGVAAKDISVTRYYVPLMPALAVIIAAAVGAGATPRTLPARGLRVAGVVAVLLVCAHGGASIITYLRQPAYTYQRMGQDLARRIERLDRQTDWVIYGPWPSNGVALAAGMPPMTTIASPGNPLLKHYPPAYLVTRGPRDEAMTPEQLQAVERLFDFGTEHTYRVLAGMFADTDPLFHAVRLQPRAASPGPAGPRRDPAPADDG
jgi:hypothetical protein